MNICVSSQYCTRNLELGAWGWVGMRDKCRGQGHAGTPITLGRVKSADQSVLRLIVASLVRWEQCLPGYHLATPPESSPPCQTGGRTALTTPQRNVCPTLHREWCLPLIW